MGKSSKSEGSVLIGSKSVEESGSEELSNEADDCSCWVSVEGVGLAVVSGVEVLEMSVSATAGGPEFVLGGTVVVVMAVLLVVVVLGLWQVEAGDGVLLAVGLVGAAAAEVVEAGVDRF